MDQQYSLKSGLKRFGEKREHEVTSDIDRLHGMETFAPLDANEPTKKNREDALESLTFLKEKGMEELKGEHVLMGENKGHI